MQLSQNLLYFTWTGPGKKYIDIARCLSLINRKLHRQQGLWTIGGVKFQTDSVPAGGGGVEVQLSHAPKVWPVRNALVMGFEHWKEQQQRAYKAGASSLKPKWQDFKVWLNNDHRNNALSELMPYDGGPLGSNPVSTTSAEWIKSKYVFTELDPDVGAGGDEVIKHQPEIHILGGDNGMTNVGLVHNYSLMRSRPDAGASAGTGHPEHATNAETSIFTRSSEAVDESIEQIVENLTDDNDMPPYDPDNYPGASSNFKEPVMGCYAQLAANDVGRTVSLNGFSAPNGLITVQTTSASDGVNHLMLYVVGRSGS